MPVVEGIDFTKAPDKPLDPENPPVETAQINWGGLPDQKRVPPEWTPVQMPREVDDKTIKDTMALAALYDVSPQSIAQDLEMFKEGVDKAHGLGVAERITNIVKPVPALAWGGVMEAGAGALGLLGFDERAETMREDVALVKRQVETDNPLERGSWSEATRNAFVSIYTQAPAFGIGLLLRGRAAALSLMGTQAGLQKSSELLEAGEEKGIALMGGAISGFSEAATEMIPFNAFVDILKKSPGVGTSIVKLILGEQVGEQMNTAVDFAIDSVTVNPEMTWEDYLQRVKMTAKATLVRTGVMGAGIGTYKAAVDRGETKELVNEMPDELRKIFDETKKDATGDGMENVKATMTALDAVDQTEDGKAYFEATSKETVKAEPTIEDVFERITQEDLTEAELDEVLEGVAGGREAFEEQVVSAPVAEIKQRLLDTGMDEVEASSNAALFDGFRVLAERAGLSTEEVVARFLPQVTREAPALAEVTDAERTAIGDNTFLSERFITEEQLSNPDLLANAREELSTILEDQKEEQTFSDEEIQQVNEAIGFIDRRAGGIKDQRQQGPVGPLGKMTQIIENNMPDMATGQEVLEILKEHGTLDKIMQSSEIENFVKTKDEFTRKEVADFLRPRGGISFTPTGINIILLKNADQSTFVHETGHIYLRLMRDLSTLESATPQLKADFEAVNEWLGVTEEQNGEITREQEEQFARGFEAFLMEGKAPTPALRQAFENFKQWLSEVYQSLLDLDVVLSDDIRGVMDRMLADEGVEVAEPAAEGLEQLDTEEIAKLDILEQSAFHGTPHKFDKFTLDHIGTGEGAQAFGWGLYFAENESVAQFYREQLSKADLRDVDSAQIAAARDFKKDGVSLGEAIEGMKAAFPDASNKDITAALSEPYEQTGALIKVELAPEADEWLDWDKPLGEQSEKVQAILKEKLDYDPAEFSDDIGQDVYRFLADTPAGTIHFEDKKKASLALKEAGIPGIRYFDATSRTEQEGTSNFVVFDEELVQIEEFLGDGSEVFEQAPAAQAGLKPTFAVNQVATEMIPESTKGLLPSKAEKGIYATVGGRLNLTGLNMANLERVIDAILDVQ